MSTSSLRVGILGAGTVGAQVIRILREDTTLSERIGMPITITGVLVRNIATPRGAEFPEELLTDDPNVLFPENPQERPHIIVELMGGIEPARSLITRALDNGMTVVTANKALIATHGPELFACADKNNAGLYFEAAVAGAIPVIRIIRESLAGDKITKIQGIVNGTTNYILDSMTSKGLSYDIALAKAQELGYAEADPTADVEGHDAAAKCAILASLAFNAHVTLDDVDVTGISSITADDIAAAQKQGEVIKLIATAEHYETSEGETIRVNVSPQALSASHPLASVNGAFNAVYLTCENAGELMLSGAGAGGAPTASAVCGDIVQAARISVMGQRLARHPEERRVTITQ